MASPRASKAAQRTLRSLLLMLLLLLWSMRPWVSSPRSLRRRRPRGPRRRAAWAGPRRGASTEPWKRRRRRRLRRQADRGASVVAGDADATSSAPARALLRARRGQPFPRGEEEGGNGRSGETAFRKREGKVKGEKEKVFFSFSIASSLRASEASQKKKGRKNVSQNERALQAVQAHALRFGPQDRVCSADAMQG